MASLILRSATPVLMVLLIIFSIFALLRGHHEPGGGFVAGLLNASAFTLHALAFDVPSTRRLLGIAPQRIMGLGLVTMLVSGLPGLIRGGAYLTGVWVTIPLSGVEPVQVGTPLLFELGVYGAVTGMVLLIILTAAERRP